MRRVSAGAIFALAVSAPHVAHAAGDLQSPEQVSTRYSAYSLPARQWSVDAGALGVGDGDVFALLAVTYGLGLILGYAEQSEDRRRRGALVAGAMVVLAVVAFWYFLPIYTAQVIPRSSWNARVWLPSWT